MKKIAIGLVGFFLLVLVILFVALVSLGSFVTPDFLVKQIEKSLNVRAQVQSVHISIFSALSGFEIEGIQLARRDSFADSATPLKDRPVIPDAVVSIGKAELGIGLGAILKKEFRLEKLILQEPKLSLVLFENGSNNLSTLFRPPVTVEGQPNPALSPDALKARQLEEEITAKQKEEVASNEPFSIRSLPISLTMGELGLKNGNFTINMKKTNQVIHLRNTNIVLRDMDINPTNLEKQNSVKLDLGFDLSVIGASSQESARFLLSSGGTIVPFDKTTGQPNPAVVHSVKIRKGSFLSGFAAFDALAGGLPALKSLNIKLDSFSQKAELKSDVETKLGYTKGRVSFLDSPTFPTTNYDLKIETGTWIQITNNSHQMKGKIIATQEESKRALAGLDSTLEANAKGADTTEIKKQILGNLLEGDRIALPFQSSGNIASPVVALGIELPSISGLLKGAATQAVKDAFQKAVPPQAKDALKKFGF